VNKLTFIADTSPVESGLVNVGPLPPDDTVSTSVSPPSGATKKDWRLPTGEISFTALLLLVSDSFRELPRGGNALKDAVVLGMRRDPGGVFSRLGLFDECKGAGVRVKEIARDECGKSACKDGEFNHGRVLRAGAKEEKNVKEKDWEGGTRPKKEIDGGQERGETMKKLYVIGGQ
jgi:hypothetical protein